jgi:Cu+-exporting ATPase
MSENELLSISLGLQLRSEHPLAKAIIRAGRERGFPMKPAEKLVAQPGFGVQGIVDGKTALLGSRRFMREKSVIIPPELIASADQFEKKGKTVSWIAAGSEKFEVVGFATFSDSLKANAKQVIRDLNRMGIRTVMLTGDNEGAAEEIARSLELGGYRSNVLPGEKSAEVEKIKSGGEVVAMVGDGLNDAPAIAAADVGIALSTGTDVAMHAASVTLMRGDLSLVTETIRVSRRTYQKIRQNLFWAFFYNIVGIPLAALGYLSPMVAGAAMALSSVSVVGNSLLLKNNR